MRCGSGWWMLSVAVFFSFTVVDSIQVDLRNDNGVKTAVYLSPAIELEPGLVSNKNYYDIDFPRGHIAIKRFFAELVDEAGNSVPLHQTYIHHWLTGRYYHSEEFEDVIVVKNSGLCDQALTFYFGLGSETRKTDNHIPDPYGIEVGNPADIPPGYEEKWFVNVHAIDIRGAEDKFGCLECRCVLYNVTKDSSGQPLREGYTGGLSCCYDGTRCRVKEGFYGSRRSIFLKYMVEYVEWDSSIIPVKIFAIDVMDTWKSTNESSEVVSGHHCQVEYEIEPSTTNDDENRCVDARKVTVSFPINGDLIYGVGHQHAAGLGSTLYGEDGRVMCSSTPIYGKGEEAGNESGYLVGMSSCYPKPGSIKISKGKMVTLESKYSCNQRHTGVMGFIYLLVADSPPRQSSIFQASLAVDEMFLNPGIIGVAILIVAVLAATVIIHQKRKHEDGYESITN